ncbi:MAG: hypothetical protein L6R36_003488 [Xanthoria steineri]|nr:MAG: hypothetical protein L6R36_003488 [Xanthoria steineri]
MAEKESLRILLIGGGGREHALTWKLSQSARVETIFCAPGNGATGNVRKAINVPSLSPDQHADLLVFAKESSINLVVVGPEVPLVAGIVDVFESDGIQCFGPRAAAARMEGSKTFAKDFMARHHIPTARYRNFSDYAEAKKHLESVDYKVVLKASGLAAGKGVILPSSDSKQQMYDALRATMVDKQFGSAGSEVIFEEYLEGQELSYLSFVDGYTVKSLTPAQDHKQIFDNDQGPNTGGMGCYAPTPIASQKLVQEVHRTILQPTIDGMRKERMPFKGLLFTGIMLTKDGPKVLEYNVRFGDPETQTLLPLMDGDLAEVMLACTNGYLDTVDVKCKNSSCVTVVAAAGGYPGSYKKGDPITIDAEAYEAEDTNIFHAGTSLDSGTLRTAGGRVLAATAVAPDLETALSKAYKTMSKIQFEGIYYRKDIAHRALSHHSLSASSHKRPEVPLTYASAGVSIDAGTELVNRIKPLAASTRQFGTKSSIGGFGGQVDLAAAGYEQSPIISSGVDGVGTKSRLAIRMNKHDTIGIDLVAMVANDILTEGAEPLWLMDTMNMHQLDVETGVSIVRGVTNGCIQANCNLAGGETAELGDIIKEDHYILDASCSGALRNGRKPLPRKDDMEKGDVLLGLTSSGPHSNGYSLIHKIVERSDLAFSSPAPWDPSTSVGLSLLTPTKIYVRALLPLFEKDLVKGAAHITGGGLVENLPRILPPGLQAVVEATSWEVPVVFRWLKREGHVEKEEMARVFNMGIGMVLVVAEGLVNQATKMLEEKGEKVFRIGGLVGREEGGVGCVVHDKGV